MFHAFKRQFQRGRKKGFNKLLEYSTEIYLYKFSIFKTTPSSFHFFKAALQKALQSNLGFCPQRRRKPRFQRSRNPLEIALRAQTFTKKVFTEHVKQNLYFVAFPGRNSPRAIHTPPPASNISGVKTAASRGLVVSTTPKTGLRLATFRYVNFLTKAEAWSCSTLLNVRSWFRIADFPLLLPVLCQRTSEKMFFVQFSLVSFIFSLYVG